MARLGAKTVPVVAKGGRYVHGVRLKEVSELVGQPFQPGPQLAPEQLIQKLDVVLAASQRYISQVPPEKLDLKSPDRDRPLRGVAYHTFRLVQAFLDAAGGQELTIDALGEPSPPELTTGTAIAEYGQGVRERVQNWWQANQVRDFSEPIATYYGPESLHNLLERSTWHSAQHVRHLMLFLSWIDLTPDGPITEADLAGLPMPEAVW